MDWVILEVFSNLNEFTSLPVNSNRMRSGVLELCQGRFRLDIRKNFSKGVAGHWNRLTRSVLGSLKM